MLKEKDYIQSFMDHFCDVKDPRQRSKVQHSMMELLFLAIVATASAAQSWGEIEAFGKAHLAILKKYFPFESGAPSDCTIRRFFRSLCHSKMNEILQKHFGEALKEKHYAIDGKTLRGSKYEDKRALHFLNVYAVESGITIYGQVIDSKDNEITVIPEALEALDLEGTTVTIDAMGCQRNIAKQIIDKNGDYIFGLKKNQENLYFEVEKLFNLSNEKTKKDFAITSETGHGRMEIRECRIIKDLSKVSELVSEKWAGLKSVVEIRRKTTKKDKVTSSVDYYISSLDRSADEMLGKIRNHWKIEAMHWSLDVVFGEDDNKMRDKNAAANMAIVRRFALNIVDKMKAKKKDTRPKIMLAMGWSQDNLCKFIDKLLKVNNRS